MLLVEGVLMKLLKRIHINVSNFTVTHPTVVPNIYGFRLTNNQCLLINALPLAQITLTMQGGLSLMVTITSTDILLPTLLMLSLLQMGIIANHISPKSKAPKVFQGKLCTVLISTNPVYLRISTC